MAENLKLCFGCMELKTDEVICPYCGYSSNAPYLPSYIAPGTILNERYLIGKLLRYNGESANYIAYDSVTNRKILIKEYMPDTLCSRVRGSSIISVNQKNLVQYKAFMSEFTELNKILAKMRTLNHINPALELFSENNTTYVVFEYIDGITLKDYLQENAGELSWDEVKKLFPPIFTTLSLVHNAGLIHRGISLDTIWYTSKGELKLTEFCITAGRTANSEIAPEIFAGYAAPEQYSSSNWQGTWTDVYAISAVLYRMLTGCMPIEAISRIGNDNLCEPSSINPNIPSNVSKVIMNGLKLSGDMRIQTVTELVTKLFEQPDYLDQGAGRTATITVPNQQIKSRSQQSNVKTGIPSKEKKKKEKLQKFRVALLVFVVVIVILSIGAIIFLSMNNDNEKNASKMGSDNSASDQLAMGQDVITTTAETTAETVESSSVTSVAKDYQMPSFISKNFETIKNSESYEGWLVFTPKYEYNDEYGKDIIYEQSIPENEFVAKGTEVILTISKGSKYVTVPDYYGLTEKDYTEKLNDAGIKFNRIPQENSDFLEGYVTGTSKEPGENIDVANGEVLDVYICEDSGSDDYQD